MKRGAPRAVAADLVELGRLRHYLTREQDARLSGFPTIDGLMGGRYTPAIRAFFDREYGIQGNGHVGAPHQPAQLDAPWKKPRKRRQQP